METHEDQMWNAFAQMLLLPLFVRGKHKARKRFLCELPWDSLERKEMASQNLCLSWFLIPPASSRFKSLTGTLSNYPRLYWMKP